LPSGGGFWTPDNRIVFGSFRLGVRQVAASGGNSVTIIPGGLKWAPSLLPDKRHFLYLSVTGSADSGVYVGSLGTNSNQQQLRKLLPETSPAAFVPDPDGRGRSEKGYLLFLRGARVVNFNLSAGTLTAQSFDATKQELTGEPLPIAEQVGSFSVSPVGVLVYRAASALSAGSAGWGRGSTEGGPVWLDRHGKALGP